MSALRIIEWGRGPELLEVAVPAPAPGEVLVAVDAVGLCHTDVHLIHAEPGAFAFPTPFTLGHEIAGHVADANGTGWAEGRAVVVALGPRCWRCDRCLRGHDDLCVERQFGRGWGLDGGLARYVPVATRELVPLRSLDAATAAPLSDAGVTAYHTVRRVAPALVGPSVAVVIGVGGLGGLAVQFLRRLTTAHVIALDIHEHRRAAARRFGAAETVATPAELVDAVAERSGGRGAEAVLDFVGSTETMELALRLGRSGGSIAIPGAGGGTATIGWGRVPNSCDVFIPMGGTTADLHDVVALAEAGDIHVDVEHFPFDDVLQAYDAVASGTVTGRAVVAIP